MPASLAKQVEQIVAQTPIFDVHTHLCPPAFGELFLWGIDDLLTYHYLISEAFRQSDVPYEKFWALSKTQQADLIWDALFIHHSPISESCRGVLTTLNALGLDLQKRDLPSVRKWFAQQKPEDYLDRCMELANVKAICMTNSPFDDLERPIWEKGYKGDPRFAPALRIDPLLLSWPQTSASLAKWGYNVTADLSQKTLSEVRRFLSDWTKKIGARYVMVSLPPDFRFPTERAPKENDCVCLIEHAVLPQCREFNLPFAMMPGVKRAINPQLKLAGDGVGLSDLQPIATLCAQFPQNKFAITILARENQFELTVLARKFRNLHVFGCWWFNNNPSIIDELTRMRIEMLGFSFTPQHSDARVLDQLIYKWRHSREVISRVLVEKYTDLSATGWQPSEVEIKRDVADLFGGAFERFCKS
jgi:hypothetical protein